MDLPGRVGCGSVGGLGSPGRDVIAVLDEGALGRDGEGSQPVNLVGVAAVPGIVALLRQTAVATLPLVVGNCRQKKKKMKKTEKKKKILHIKYVINCKKQKRH